MSTEPTRSNIGNMFPVILTDPFVRNEMKRRRAELDDRNPVPGFVNLVTCFTEFLHLHKVDAHDVYLTQYLLTICAVFGEAGKEKTVLSLAAEALKNSQEYNESSHYSACLADAEKTIIGFLGVKSA